MSRGVGSRCVRWGAGIVAIVACADARADGVVGTDTYPAAGVDASAAPALPPAPPGFVDARFGARGVFVLSGGSIVSASYLSYDSSAAIRESVTFSPGADFFVASNVSIGIDADVSDSDSRGYGADGSLVDTRTTTVAFAPRLGFNVQLGDLFSWWPRVTAGYQTTSTREESVSGTSLSVAGNPLGYPSTTQSGPFIKLAAPLLVHPVRHLVVGLGPTLYRNFGSVTGGPNVGGQETTFGASVIVAAYWGGAPELATTAAAPVKPPARFGEAGRVVLSGETVVNVDSTSYVGSASSEVSATFAPAVDVFVADQFALGLGVAVSYSRTQGRDGTTGDVVVNTVNGHSVSLRASVDVPMGPWVSLFPRVSIGLGGDSYDETSGASENRYDESITSIGLYVPLLVHPAPHAFVGFGPSVSHDLTRSLSVPDAPLASAPQNRSTSVGAGLVVGGWM